MAAKSIPVPNVLRSGRTKDSVSNAAALRVREEKTIYAAMLILEGRMRLPGEALTCPSIAGKYAALRLGGRERETFAVFFLDTKNRLVAFEELFHGSIDTATVHPREVVKRALVHNAAAAIFAHNHPSGDVTPSGADRCITLQLLQALALIEVRVIDHIVVAGMQTCSMAERGFHFHNDPPPTLVESGARREGCNGRKTARRLNAARSRSEVAPTAGGSTS